MDVIRDEVDLVSVSKSEWSILQWFREDLRTTMDASHPGHFMSRVGYSSVNEKPRGRLHVREQLNHAWKDCIYR